MGTSRRLAGSYGPIYNFVPTTFVLPNEYVSFMREYAEQTEKNIWICKPRSAPQRAALLPQTAALLPQIDAICCRLRQRYSGAVDGGSAAINGGRADESGAGVQRLFAGEGHLPHQRHVPAHLRPGTAQWYCMHCTGSAVPWYGMRYT